MSREKGSAGNNNTLKCTHIYTHKLTLFPKVLQNRDERHRYICMPCVKRWGWVNRHTVHLITWSFLWLWCISSAVCMAVCEPAEKGNKCRVVFARSCLRHEKNYSSYLWSDARVPLCIQSLFTFFYLLMQPFVSLSNSVAEKNKAASYFLTRVHKS